MVWNYRGYGRSKGKPSPDILKSDSEVVLEYLRRVMGLRGKIGIYGRSLGGIATTHLADKVNLIVADRTFANFKDLAIRKFYQNKS